MTGNEYQVLAMRTCSITEDPEAKLRHGVFGLASEAGEVSGIFQKVYQGHELDIDHVVKECGDCLWMIAEILDALDIELEECMEMNISKLKARYPDGFTAERSLHRVEGDV